MRKNWVSVSETYSLVSKSGEEEQPETSYRGVLLLKMVIQSNINRIKNASISENIFNLRQILIEIAILEMREIYL